VACVLVGFVSWMDLLMMVIYRSWPMLPPGAAGSCLADSLFSSTAGAQPGKARIMVTAQGPFSFSSVPLYHYALTHLVN